MIPAKRSLLSTLIHHSVELVQRRSLATGSRGARGHGWYLNYRASKGGRHLQGGYHDRESLEECERWNDAILQLGSTRVFLDVVVEPRTSPLIATQKVIDIPPLEELKGERHRLTIDIATRVLSETTDNFIELLDRQKDKGYFGTRLYRVEKKVGLYGGDVLTNTGKTGKAARGNPLTIDIHQDPLAMWHIPGTVTMLVPKVGEIDSRFLLCSQWAPHIDGICRAFGRLTPESLHVVTKWQTTLLTRNGVPTACDLIVADCGVLDEITGHEEAIPSDNEESDTREEKVAESA